MVFKNYELMKNFENKINDSIKPLVSVIIPSYNRIETVGQTIESILSQKCNFSFEVIIGDDRSNDNVRELLTKYQQKYPEIIRLFLHEENIGLGANWAFCVKQCKGKYIANCDNDDYWHNPDKLQLQVDFMETHPEYGVCHTDFRNYYKKSGRILEEKVSEIKYDIPMSRAVFEGKFRFCNATMMYRKDLIDRYIVLDDYIERQFTLQDWMTLIILARFTEIYCLPVSTTTLGIDDASITRPKSFEKLLNRFNKEKECYQYVCSKFPEDLIYDETDYMNYSYKVFLNYAFLYSDYSIAQKYGRLLLKNNQKEKRLLFTTNKLFFMIYSAWFKISQK